MHYRLQCINHRVSHEPISDDNDKMTARPNHPRSLLHPDALFIGPPVPCTLRALMAKLATRAHFVAKAAFVEPCQAQRLKRNIVIDAGVRRRCHHSIHVAGRPWLPSICSVKPNGRRALRHLCLQRFEPSAQLPRFFMKQD